MVQTMKLNAVGINATPENATTIMESAETMASVNLSGFKATATGSTKTTVRMPGQAENTSTTHAAVYQIGNSTYVKMMPEIGHTSSIRGLRRLSGAKTITTR